MEWPSQSPDLNPIENLWRYIKVRLRGKPKSKSKDALLENINNIWDNIPQSMFDTFIDSMPHRVKAVLEAKGGHTKYWRKPASKVAANKVKRLFLCVFSTLATSISRSRDETSSSFIYDRFMGTYSAPVENLGLSPPYVKPTQLLENRFFRVKITHKMLLWPVWWPGVAYPCCPAGSTFV